MEGLGSRRLTDQGVGHTKAGDENRSPDIQNEQKQKH